MSCDQIERSKREIAAGEAEILAGNPDLPGLCLALYDWHSRHHTAHITELRKRMGW